MKTNHTKHPPGFLVPVIDPNRCEGKGPCIDVCPTNVFEMGVLTKTEKHQLTITGKIKGLVHGWKQAKVTDPAACQACALCVVACPEKAIALVKANQLNPLKP
jgi:4Fe-4S ferredoxin